MNLLARIRGWLRARRFPRMKGRALDAHAQYAMGLARVGRLERLPLIGDWLFRRRLWRWQKWQTMAPATGAWLDAGAAVMRASAMSPMEAYEALRSGLAMGTSASHAAEAITQAFGRWPGEARRG